MDALIDIVLDMRKLLNAYNKKNIQKKEYCELMEEFLNVLEVEIIDNKRKKRK